MTRRRALRAGRRGFTLVETDVSTLLVGLVLAAALRTVGLVFTSRSGSSDRAIAQALADQLLSEILEKKYRDPNQTPVFGPESGETSRSAYDDIDDYHNQNETTLRFRDNVAIGGLTGWTRAVSVQEVASNDAILTTSIRVGGNPVGYGLGGSGTPTGVRRITVTVRRNGALLATAQALRTQSGR